MLFSTYCMSILLNIMFHPPMGRFQLELFVSPLFSTVVPSNILTNFVCVSEILFVNVCVQHAILEDFLKVYYT